MDSKKENKNSKQSSRRRFLKGAALAGLAAAGGIGSARGQGGPGQNDPRQRTDFVPEEEVPKDHVLRDPWTGEMMRDEEGNLIVDWTGTPQWEKYQKNAKEIGRASCRERV